MKLIYCPKCGDVRKLGYGSDERPTLCNCASSWGYYENDGLHAVVGGWATPIGIHNSDFLKALDAEDQRTKNGEKPELGVRFEAFTIPESAPTIRRG